MVHKAQHLVKVLKMRLHADGFNHGGNSAVNRAQAGVVLGWVTSREVLVLHLYEHHLDLMSNKCSIYSHERRIHVESLFMKHGSMSLTHKSQLNPNSNIKI